ncbi:ABC transporter ATP-binding protein [Halopenitus sp. H-Gu1]|uniref:ABC transporter ATP-binding protein n=1 Tax=Halopenitus sp. H-Gu1 TaxID=3242697 RepID=UPI00359E6DE1
MANLSFNDVTKTYQDESGEIVAVNDLNMDIRDGEFLIVVGPSGCGKTTTLRMIAGLETVSEGDIQLDRTPISGKRPQERDIAMVFQSYALYPHMTVRENMSFGLQQSTDLDSQEIDERVTEIAEMLGIPELLDRVPGELSGGQQQRVALGRAIVRDPEVFLMDEPLSNLDAKLRAEMRTELQRLQEKFDTTTVYVTHDQTEAMTMSDRLAILNEGELQQLGTPMDCYYEPNNLFVAGFIGEPSMNFIECSLEGTTLVSDFFSYELSGKTADELGSATEVTLGVRPEDVTVLSEPVEDNDIGVTVDVIEPFGKESNFYLRPRDDAVEETIVATVPGRKEASAGDYIGMRFPEESLYVFDKRDGSALRHPVTEREELFSAAE